METSRTPSAKTVAEITVYPVFCSFAIKKTALTDNPYICEDDNGKLAFLSEEGKRAFLSRKPHSISSHMERRR